MITPIEFSMLKRQLLAFGQQTAAALVSRQERMATCKKSTKRCSRKAVEAERNGHVKGNFSPFNPQLPAHINGNSKLVIDSGSSTAVESPCEPRNAGSNPGLD